LPPTATECTLLAASAQADRLQALAVRRDPDLLNSTFGLYDWEWTKGFQPADAGRRQFLRLGRILALGGATFCCPQVFPMGAEYLAGIHGCRSGLGADPAAVHGMGQNRPVQEAHSGAGHRQPGRQDRGNGHAGEAQGLCIVGYLPLGSSHHYVPQRVIDRDRDPVRNGNRLGATEIVVAVRERRGGGLPMADLLECKLRGLHILDLPAFLRAADRHPAAGSDQRQLDDLFRGIHPGFSARDVVKRLFDLLVSGSSCCSCLPIMLLAGC
jgi:hypothetical protein